MKAYRADFILKKLEGLHSDYFPKPADEDEDPEDGAKAMITDKSDGYMSLLEMLELYVECDKHLHRGGFKSISNRSPTYPADPKAVTRPLGRLAELLRVHTIQPLDPKWIFLVRMEGLNNTVELKRYHWTVGDGSSDLVRRRLT